MNTLYMITSLSFLQRNLMYLFSMILDLAEQRPSKQSSTAHNGFSSRAVDGKFSTAYSLKSCTQTNDETDPWWQVDLLQEYVITGK
jgi:hypothetical protein